MTMTRNKIEESITEARRFIVAAQAAIERLDVEKSGYGYRENTNWKRMTTERIRAVLRFIYPDDITPMGKRFLEKVLDDMDKQAPVSAGASSLEES